MKIEQQVASLELSRRLKELGVKADSYFGWYQFKDSDKENEWTVSDIKLIANLAESMEMANTTANTKFSLEYIPAYTVAEIGEMLKETIGEIPTSMFRNTIWMGGDIQKWYGTLETKNRDNAIYAQTEADARARMLIYLLDNNLIEIQNI